MKHLILCREYPPAPYPAGGIGTYARHIAHLLAEAGETVHVLTQRWDGAREPITRSCEGRLIVHRISLDEPFPPDAPCDGSALIVDGPHSEAALLHGLATSTCPSQVFSWQAARLAERLIDEQMIDVIEAQEWEAPLYYLQLRRRLGLGPSRRPPCIVHLHSPTQMIFEHNAWDKTLVDYLPLSRFEEFSIRAADALLCPSRYLARGVTEDFGIPPESVEIIRYCMGETPLLERSPQAWQSNAVCYVGRLELRKGVVEWVDAAVLVASTDASVSFDFFGSDTPVDGGAGESVLTHLQRRIPRHMRQRFRFHGGRTREELMRSLAACSLAVVPSRWENLPFTCIEAMATGLPVIVSPNGGMAELLQDGESGWVAEACSADALATALRRALGTVPAERAAMGARAALAVRQACANPVVLQAHLEHRRRLIAFSGDAAATSPEPPPQAPSENCGVGILLTVPRDAVGTAATLASVYAQTQPVPLVVVADPGLRERPVPIFDQRQTVLYRAQPSSELAIQEGLETLIEQWPDLLAVAVLQPPLRLAPAFATACEAAFHRQPELGIVAAWAVEDGRSGRWHTDPMPYFAPGRPDGPFPRGCAIRLQALATASTHRWLAITYPKPLIFVPKPRRRFKRRYSGMALIQNPSVSFALQWFLAASPSEKARWLQRITTHPGRVTRWIAAQSRRALGGRSV